MWATNLIRIIVLLSLMAGYCVPWGAAAPTSSPGEPTVGPMRPAVAFGSSRPDRGVAVGWHLELLPPGRVRQARNPKRNRQRRRRRYQRWLRQQPPPGRHRTRRPRRGVGPQAPGRPVVVPSVATAPSPGGAEAHLEREGDGGTSAPDPLAHLRQQRGWIDRLPAAELWELLRQVRRAHGGPRCPHCGKESPTGLEVIDRHYRGGLYRYRCRVCYLAGDPGEGGTFTDLTGTLFDGCRLDIRSLWLVVEHFVAQQAAVESADQVGISRHTVDRYYRLLRAAIYQLRSRDTLTLGADDLVEGDEVYLTAGLKGHAGGLALNREPRRRGLKRRGRGTWQSDRIPVLGLIRRGGELRLFAVRNVQSATLQPLIEQCIQKGATVYTDSYSSYHFLAQEGYRHATINHGAGEYARGEVHCNTIECTWSWLRQAIRTYRGVSKVYLPLYVVQFEFFYNRRRQNRWSQMLDVLSLAFQADAESLLDVVEGAAFAQVCPMPG